MTKISLGDWMYATRSRLTGKSEFPLIEINAITSHVLQKPIEWIFSHPEFELTKTQLNDLDMLVARLLDKEPLAYITGRRSFYGLDFSVDKRVLIPRPETELLLDEAIRWLKTHPGCRRVADIGTGSGAIAVTIAVQFSDVNVVAIDVSEVALQVAKHNARAMHVDGQILFKQNDLLTNLPYKFDLILANLPYIPSKDLDGLDVNRFEPRLALDGGEDGLECISALLEQSKKSLLSEGCIFLEIQYNQSIQVIKIASQIFPNAEITAYQDLASLPRLIQIQLRGDGK